MAGMTSACALAALVSMHGFAATNRTPAMDDAEQLLARMRQMTDSAYMAGDQSSVATLPADALRSQFRGVLLGAPREVDLDAGQRVSGLALIGRSKARSVEVSWRANAIVVATDVERGVVRTAGAFDIDTGKEGERPRAKPLPTAEPVRSAAEKARLEALGDGDTAGFVWLDVSRLLDLPRESARYVVRVLYFDQVSNPAVVNVRARTSQPAAEPLAAASAQASLSAVTQQASTQGLPRFGRGSLTPSIEGPGVALNLGVPGVVAGARQWLAHGVLKLELSRQMIVGSATVSGAPLAAGSSKPPAALVRATVLVLMKDQTRAMRLPLDIPVWSDHALRAGEVVEAAFSVDLATVLPASPPPGIYQVYLLGGPYLSGPHTLTL
ncbi:MAG: hypothetical protein KAY46_02470 [Burkholderiaceae bacterium]|nr:hypothetical protein [Burkholderiaceae bacterium]